MFERNWKARLIRPDEIGKVNITAGEEREGMEPGSKDSRQTVKQFVIQVRGASTMEVYTS